jgi:hypothetical protein
MLKHRKWKMENGNWEESRAALFHLPFSLLRFVWWWLRQVSGDAAYENYLASRARRGEGTRCCGSERAVSREEFYLESLRRRYSGVSRCC